jgi:membrane protease YdiL (CAAX protease family)
MATTSLTKPRTAPCTDAARTSWIARHPLPTYFVLAFVGTWLIIWPMALARGEYGLGLLPFAVPAGLDFLLVQLSSYTGPLLAAVLVTAATEGRAGLRQFRGRLGRWRVGVVWYLVATLAPLAIWLAAYSAVLSGTPLAALARQPMLLLSAFLPSVALGLLLPSLGEEPGWRGFALPRLQDRFGPALGTIILGTLHSLWHLPAFFTAGLGPFAPGKFAAFVLTGVAASFLYTLVVNRTRGSILLAILLHAAGNAASGLMNRLVPAELPLDGGMRALVDGGWLNALAFGLVALTLVALTGGRLGHHPPGAGGPGATADRS